MNSSVVPSSAWTPELSAALRELGCKRTTRQLYEHCVRTKVVSCWIVPDNILK